MKRSLIALGAAAVALATPAHAHAQFDFLTDIFEEVNSVTVSFQGGHLTSSGDLRARDNACGGLGVCGFAVEVLIDLPSLGDTELELGLGTGFLRGFEAAEPTLDLHGSLRSFPTISAYVSIPEKYAAGLAEPYAGASFGLVELWHARGYDPDGVEYELEAQTFDYGVSVGLFLVRPQGVFVEAAYRWRQFESVDWELPDAAEERVPANWPRDLDLSGWVFSVGYQFRLRDPDRADPAPPPPGPPAPQPTGSWSFTATR